MYVFPPCVFRYDRGVGGGTGCMAAGPAPAHAYLTSVSDKTCLPTLGVGPHTL
jgi:hypothetical protein